MTRQVRAQTKPGADFSAKTSLAAASLNQNDFYLVSLNSTHENIK